MEKVAMVESFFSTNPSSIFFILLDVPKLSNNTTFSKS